MLRDCLVRNNIYIDYFPEKTHTTNALFLLTHVHSDHMSIPKKFRGTIYTASPASVVAAVVPWARCVVVDVDSWQSTDNGVQYYVFNTWHAPYSCGFLFPHTTPPILYLGDGRMTNELLSVVPRHLSTNINIMYDALLETHVDLTDPGCKYICRALEAVPRLQCVHYGILWNIATCTNYRFQLHHTVSPLVATVARHMGLVDDESNYCIVGRHYNGSRVLPSTLWFIVDKSRTIDQIHYDGDFVRVFAVNHSIYSEITHWKDVCAQHTFVPIPTRPIVVRQKIHSV